MRSECVCVCEGLWFLEVEVVAAAYSLVPTAYSLTSSKISSYGSHSMEVLLPA